MRARWRRSPPSRRRSTRAPSRPRASALRPSDGRRAPSRPGRPARPKCARGATGWRSRLPPPRRPGATPRHRRAPGGSRRRARRRAHQPGRPRARGLDARARDLGAERDRLRAELATADGGRGRRLARPSPSSTPPMPPIASDSAGPNGRVRRARAPALGRRATRAADRDDLEARLGLEALREGVLVDLAGLGTLGRGPSGRRDRRGRAGDAPDRHRAAGSDPTRTTTSTAARHGARGGAGRAPPTAGRPRRRPSRRRHRAGSRQLRRRFHELGADEPVRGRGVRRAQDPPRDARDPGAPTCGPRSSGRASSSSSWTR